MRKDLKDLFDRYAILVKDAQDYDLDKTWQKHRKVLKGFIYENKSESNKKSLYC